MNVNTEEQMEAFVKALQDVCNTHGYKIIATRDETIDIYPIQDPINLKLRWYDWGKNTYYEIQEVLNERSVV